VADIIYIHILVGFVYLAVILDAYSRKVIGYALSRNLDTQMNLVALRMAIEDRKPALGCIHHSDHGVQYASGDYVKELKFYQFQISMSRKGNPLDNAYAESFIKTLKSEEVHFWEYHTIEDVPRRIPYFIEDIYNQKRLLSSLDYRPPSEFEFLLESTPNPCRNTPIPVI
jgi:transposase InsO family protein